MSNIFYVYLHFRESDGRLFYIGKGKNKRAWSHQRRNPYWKAIVAKHGLRVVIFERNLSESDAFRVEASLLKTFGIEGLANFTYGGEGPSGYKFTDEQRKRHSEMKTGLHHSEESKRKIAAAHFGMKASEETRKKLSQFRMGTKASEETRRKLEIIAREKADRNHHKEKYVFEHPVIGRLTATKREIRKIIGGDPSRLMKGFTKHLRQWKYVGPA